MSKPDGRDRTGKSTGSRPLPRRLFSFDSSKNSNAKHGLALSTSTSISDLRDSGHNRTESSVSTIREEGNPFVDRAQTPQQGSSTASEFDFLPKTAIRGADPLPSKGSKFKLHRPPPILSAKTSSDTSVPASPSILRWENLRSHVIPSHVSQSSQSSIVPPSRDGAATPVSGRSTPTPKPSRLAARLGFKQVVETARANVASEASTSQMMAPELSAFEKEVQLACWVAHHGPDIAATPNSHHSRPGHTQREPTQASIGSTLRPFVASNPFASTSTLSFTNMATTKSNISRPHSVYAPPHARQPPTVAQLHSTILSQASEVDYGSVVQPFLLLETQVLDALLMPFFPQSHPAALKMADDERILAMKAFEVVSRTWPPASPGNELNRVLWACRAASLTLSTSWVRGQLLGLIHSTLFPDNQTSCANTPAALRSLVMALVRLQATMIDPESGRKQSDSSEAQRIDHLFDKLVRLPCTLLDPAAIDAELGLKDVGDDEVESVRSAIIYSALSQSLAWLVPGKCLWLAEMIEATWEPPSRPVSQPSQHMSLRSHLTFLNASWEVMRSMKSTHAAAGKDVLKSILRHTRDHILPDLEHLNLEPELIMQARALLIRSLLTLAASAKATSNDNISPSAPVSDHALELFETLLRSPASKDWQKAMGAAIAVMLPPKGDWISVIRLLETMLEQLADGVSRTMIMIALPVMNQCLVNRFPTDVGEIASFLQKVSIKYPQVFYKPLFTCAAASKEVFLIQHLRVLASLSKLVPDFWTRDAEMIGVAITGHIGSVVSEPADKPPAPQAPRLGQVVLLLVVTSQLRSTRALKAKASESEQTTQSLRSITQFALNLEARFGAVINGQSDIHASQRALYCCLLLQCRLLSRSLRPSPWITHIAEWVVAGLQTEQGADFEYYGEIILGTEDELDDTLAKARMLLAQAVDGHEPASTHARRSVTGTPALGHGTSTTTTYPDIKHSSVFHEAFDGPLELIGDLSKGHMPLAIELLIAVSAILSTHDVRRLGAALWRRGFQSEETSLQACFLLLQSAEKASTMFMDMVTQDLKSSDSDIRHNALAKIIRLYASRFHLTSLEYIVDRNHPRPFRQTRPQLTFMLTDIGSARYVREEHVDDYKDRSGRTMPLELRKKLKEMDWDHEDAVWDKQRELAETPMTLFPLRDLERLDKDHARDGSSNPNELLRRRSSGANHIQKRRAVYIAAFGNLVPPLAPLLFDPNFAIANDARRLFMHLMKEDSSILSRPIFDLLPTGQPVDVRQALSIMQGLFHCGPVLPPAMAHVVFNHLTGLLKHLKQHQTADSLSLYTSILPYIAKVITQVSDMSMKNLRKHKVDVYMTPSWDLWFSPLALEGPMFPRYLTSHRGIESGVPLELRSITLIRTSQNMLLWRMLQKNPTEVQTFRKNSARLVLPTLQAGTSVLPLELVDFIPDAVPGYTPPPGVIKRLSTVLARSYVLLVTQIFRSLPPHLNDRQELEVYIDGLNRILITHYDDPLLVIQVMIAFFVASTRFKRLFSSAGGFTLLLPSVLKVYIECIGDQDLSMAVESTGQVNIVRNAIEYMVSRFHALHTDTFMFQMMDILSRLHQLPGYPHAWASRRFVLLLAALERGGPSHDSSGIAGSAREQERQSRLADLMEEKPQMFSFRRDTNTSGASAHGTNVRPSDLMAVMLRHEDRKLLNMTDLIKLILTVIAHNPAIVRAQNFLKLLGTLTPSLMLFGPVTETLCNGIDALAAIVLSKAAAKAKVPEAAQLKSPIGGAQEVYSHEAQIDNAAIGHTSAPSDLTIMRLDFLAMVGSFVHNGGKLHHSTLPRVQELVRILSGSPIHEHRVFTSRFLGDYVRATVATGPRMEPGSLGAFLDKVATMAEDLEQKLDISYLLNAITSVYHTPGVVRDRAIRILIVKRFCTLGMRLCMSDSLTPHYELSPIYQVVVELVSDAIVHNGDDLLDEIERCAPTPNFFAHFLIPLLLRMAITQDALANPAALKPGGVGRVWGRLLGYTLQGANAMDHTREDEQRTSLSGVRRSSSRSRSNKGATSSTASGDMLAFVFQAIKIIIIKAELILPLVLPDVWLRLSNFFLRYMGMGDAAFAVHLRDHTTHSTLMSSSPISTPSKLLSVAIPSSSYAPKRQDSADSHTSTSSKRHQFHPRLVDYLVWTTLEILAHRPHSLTLTMRPIMQAKASEAYRLILQQKASQLEHRSPGATISGRSSYRASASGSLFTKPRRRSGLPSFVFGDSVSQYGSPAGSPAGTPRSSFLTLSGISPPGSPRLPSSSPSRPSIMLNVPNADEFGLGRSAGYARHSVSSPIAGPGGVPIVHLGPMASPRTPMESPQKDVDDVSLTMRLSDHDLARRTYQALRRVQLATGYLEQVAFPNDTWFKPEEEGNRWTGDMLIEKALEDAKFLVREFSQLSFLAHLSPGPSPSAPPSPRLSPFDIPRRSSEV